ncbi:MAG TPA: vitamin K epoxide reductase family protein [Lacipirellulaceae bacterium]
MIPLPGTRIKPAIASNPVGALPAAPVRWGVRVLAMIAIAIAAYLAWTAIELKSVVGCAPSTVVDCDMVLQSGWSKWLGIPVAFIGLVAYAALLGLSFFAGRGRSEAARWAATALVMLALAVAGAGLWFDSLQVFAIEKFCLYCICVHLCGVAIAGLVLWSAFKQRNTPSAAPQKLSALAGTFRPVTAASRAAAPPSLAAPSLSAAGIGAAALLGLLIGGQILFRPKLQVSEIVLAQPVDMSNSVATSTSSNSAADPSPTAEEHVVNRIPADDAGPGSTTAAASGTDHGTHATDRKSQDDLATKDHAAKQAPGDTTPSKPEAPALSRKVTFLKGSLTVDMYQQAVIGSPTAPHVVIEIVDYACPHCRIMNKTISQAIDRYGDQLAIVIMPMPLELECNKQMPSTDPTHFGACKLARLALAIAEVDPAAFVDFHEWLMADKDKVPEIGRALTKAYRLADEKKIRERFNSDEINQRIQDNITLYTNLSAQPRKDSAPFGLPVQILGDQVIAGDTVAGDELLTKWEEILGMKPQ